MKFTVSGIVVGIGRCTHPLIAEDADSAWARFRRAYSRHKRIHWRTKRRDAE